MSYSSTIQTTFSGPSTTSTSPPHNGFAVGSNYVVMIDGSRIEWTNLTGGSPTVQSVYSFFSPLAPTGGLYDQRIVYDSVNQRFVAIMQYLAPDGTTTAIDIAVSKDSNPNDGWTFSQLNTTVTINGQSTDSDRPTLAVDGSNVYISAAQYNISVSGYAGTENWVIGDTAGAGGGIYGGGTLSVTASEVMPSTQDIFAVASGNNGKTYYASAFTSGSQISVAVQTYDKATNTFSTTSTVSLGNIDQGGTYTAQQQGTTLLLDAGDNRIASMVYANGFLYAVAEMKPTGSSVSLVHWFKIDVSNPSAPALVAQGDITGAAIGTSVATFNPSIAVDAAGDVLINFTASGPNMYPADYYVFQGGSDPVGSFSAPVLYQASTGFFNSGNGASVQDWGRNSSATVDPNNPNSFWISNEYVASGWWQTAVAQITIQNSVAGPAISSIAASGTAISNGAGDLNAGQVVTLTVNFAAAVTVNTAGGAPTLTLNDGGTASYTGGSGGTALTFSYTVAAGQNTADLVISALNLNGATIADGGGNAANLSGATNYNPTGILQIDTTAPTIASIVATGAAISNGSGNLSTGQVVTLTVNLSEAVTVNTSGGAPTLPLNDGGTASFTGGSGSTALTFSYTVAAGQTTSDLAISALNLNGAVINDGAGNATNLSGATNYNPAGTLQVNFTAPSIASIAASGTGITSGAGDLNAGQVVTLTVNFAAAVTVNTTGGAPTLTLNDGGTASFTGGSGGTALTFSYTVAAGQNTADLVISALNLNGATIADAGGNAANLSGATNYNPTGILQIDTTAPTITSIVATGAAISNGSGNLSTGQVVTLTVNLSEAVTVNTSGGAPTLTLNDGGTASFTGGSGSTALTFSYTVAAGQTTSDLAISALNLNGAVISDGAGNAANLSGATNYNPAGTLQVNVTTPTSSIQTLFSGPSTTSASPPHNGLAVGPNYIVMIEGSRIEWTNLTGGSPTLQSVYSFFSPLSPTGGLYDQRIAYDSVNQRFVVIMQYLAPGATATDIDIAVSKDSNPNDGWTFSQLNTTVTINGQSTGSDRPMLAVDGSNVYITAPQYGLSASAYAGTENWIIGDTAGAGGGIYGGGTLNLTASEIMPSTQGIFAVASGNNGKTYYASDFSSGGQIVVALQTYDKVTNTFSTTSTIALGSIDQGGSYTLQQQGTSLLLDAVDNRIASMVYANGYLYAVAEMKPSGSSVPLVHWFKIDVSNASAPTLVAQGDISGASLGTNVATFDPSIAVDAAGDVIINFTASGPNMYPSDYYVFQGGSSPVGSFSAPILYQASTSFFNSGDGNSTQRWGLNSSATVDPNNPNSFWISSEYVANNWWQTSVAQITIQNPAGTGPVISSIAASGTGITNGAGDLNAGKLVTLTVNFGAAVTVNTSGGTPTLVLNDGGTASYTGGSGGTALTFSYTVAAGQNTADLLISSFNLNGAGITDGSGNAANLSAATNYNPLGTLQIDTTAPTIASIAASGTGITNGSGNVSTGQVITLTVNLNEAVTVNTSGGSPTLALNDGGTANYTGGSGGSALTFSYTVAAGQTTSDLAISGLNLNGAVVNDGAGNVANLSAATNYNPTGTLQVNSTNTAGVPQFSHIVVVVEENKDDSQITGNTTEAPYLNYLMNNGAMLTNFSAETHPSQSNYFALYAGSTFGFNDDNPHSLPDPTLYTILQGAGRTFQGYVDEGNGGSDFNHDPWVSFPEGRTVQTDFTSFPSLFANGDYSSLPTVSFVIPSIGNDMHDGTIAQGDTWLQQNLGAYAQWALTNNSLLIVTWDENEEVDPSNQIATFFYGANVVTGNYGTAYNHYNVLSTILASYGLTGPNNAATAAPIQVFGGATPAVSPPTIASIAASGTGITSGSGNLNTGNVVTLTVNFSAAVTVNTTGGAPTLILNDGGTASYTSGSGGTALTFSHTVAPGQNTADLIVAALNLNGATITGGGGTAANLSGATNANPAGTLQIDTTAPTIASIAASGTGITSGSGNLNAGKVVTLTVNFSEAVTVNTTGGAPTLTLNDGGTASYSSGSSGTALTFSYTVAAGQNTADLIVSALNLNGATITDGAGNAATLSGATNFNPAGTLQIDTTASTIASIAASGTGITSGSGNLNAGKVVTLTVNFSEAVTVNTTGGAPTLTLNDGGTASYTSGSGGTALTFSYTVAAGQNTADLIVSALNLNGATITDGAGNAATLSGATNFNPAGILQIDTTASTIASIAASGTGITSGSGNLNAGKVVTLTVSFSDAVTVNTTGGAPTLTLNDGGTASYTSGSGGTALTFSYTVAAGQNTADLIVSALNLNGATITDGAGNTANLSGATNANPTGTLKIDTTAPTIASIVATGTGITSGTGNVNTGGVVTLTVNLGEVVTVNTTGGTPTLVLNDGGTASYISGSGSTALTFRYTVAAVQTTADLAISSFNLNGGVVNDAAGNALNLAGAANYNPSGILQINRPPATIASIATSGTGITSGAGDLNAGKVVTLTVNFSAAMTVNTAGGTPRLNLNDGGTASYTGGSGSTALTFSYTVAAGQNTADLIVSSLALNGGTIIDGNGNAANLSGATNFNPAGTLQIDTTAPTIAISTIAGDNIVNATEGAAGFAISGTTSGAENGRIVTVNLLNSANAIVNSYTKAVSANAWSVAVTSAQAAALADGSYTVSANVSDAAGNAAPTATRALTMDQDKVPEVPGLTISSTSLTVQAGGSIALGITATPVDSDDKLSLTISGLPSYESITAPAGNTVTSSLQSNGTYTWTITEGAATTGTPLTGLTLSSSYTGTDHPVAIFTVTASNTTTGETATSASQTMTVTDPPAAASSSAGPAIGSSLGNIDRLAALMDQFAAAGFHGGPSGPVPSAFYPQIGVENPFLAASHSHTG